jgi:hypothetical protein
VFLGWRVSIISGVTLNTNRRDLAVNTDLDTLATTLYVTIDDLLDDHPDWLPERPVVGIEPVLTDSELLTLAVIQQLLGHHSEARFIRYARSHLRSWFPYIPQRSGYTKRLKKLIPAMSHIISVLCRQCPSFFDDVWLIDSTPVECGRSRETAKRSDLAGWANYGYCASHSRYFWGLRCHIIATPSGLPISFALTSAKHDERETALDMFNTDPKLQRLNQTLIADKGYRSAEFETVLNEHQITLIRPAAKNEKPRPLTKFLKPFRQIIESINQTLKSQLDLERHGARKPEGLTTRILQKFLALTVAIWYNETTNQPHPPRTITPYDH